MRGVSGFRHLCKNSGECTAGKQGSLHVAEWAWLAEEEEGEGSPLMCCLGAAKKEAANPGPPPGLKPPQRFDIFTPQKKPDPQPVGEIAQWCDKHGVPEAADALTYNGVRAIAEIAVLSDAQLEIPSSVPLRGRWGWRRRARLAGHC